MKDLVGSSTTHSSQDTDTYDERLCLFQCRKWLEPNNTTFGVNKRFYYVLCHKYLVKKAIFISVYKLWHGIIECFCSTHNSLCFLTTVSIFIYQMFQAVVLSLDHITQGQFSRPTLERGSLKQIMSYQHKDHKDFILRQPVWYGEKPRSKLVHTMHKCKREKKNHEIFKFANATLQFRVCSPTCFQTVINFNQL